MKGKVILNTALVLISVSALVISIVNTCAGSNTKFVDVKKLYDGFDMKKEYETEFRKTQTARQRILDSLELGLKILSQKIDNSQGRDKDLVSIFQIRREEYLNKKQQLTEDNTATVQDYDAKILKQLNQYIEEYGKAKNHEYILGYSGGGEVIYGKENNNITQELIIYINDRYKGGPGK